MYNVGDKVTIIDDLEKRGENGEYESTVGYNRQMAPWAGREMTIKRIGSRHDDRYIYYICEEDDGEWMWHESMFKETESQKEERPMVEHNAVEKIDRADIIKNIYTTLDICDIYHATDEGLNTVLDKWAEEKGRSDVWEGNSVIDILSKHPDYIPEKGYIVKKNEYDRGIDSEVVRDVMRTVISALYYPTSSGIVKEVPIKPWSYSEVEMYRDKLNSVLSIIRRDPFFSYRGMGEKEIEKERDIWANRLNILEETYTIMDCKCYVSEELEQTRKVRRLMENIEGWAREKLMSMTEEEYAKPMIIDEDVVRYITDSGLTIRGIRAGQKFNKVINKILAETGVKDVWDEYNKQSARLGDAASPTKFTKFTIISANPVDYWRMSFGDSWKSCHTIDKNGNYRPSYGGNGYEGMHASGCSSYMLDPSTVVMYTVKETYEGTDYEMEPKVERCLFHLGERKFIMGRVYPQGTDGAADVYRQWRTIFQQIIAECMGETNYWKTDKDNCNKLSQIKSRGTHYRDYEYGYCDIAGWSYLKPTSDTVPSDRKIIIGATPICPCCGEEHYVEDNIECEHCNGNYICCADCGYEGDRDNMYYIDGEWYCEDCVVYCEYHEEYEPRMGDFTYVENYGYVCDCALDNGDFNYCEHCEQWYYADGIETEDGKWFCCEECAWDSDYLCVDGRWYPQDELYYCDVCGEYVLEEDWNSELEMCNNCADNNEEHGVA